MLILHSCNPNISLDKNQTNCCFRRSNFSREIHQEKISFSEYSSRLRNRKLKILILPINCSSSLEQGLKPRPKLKPSIIESNVEKLAKFEETQIVKTVNSGICGQIEKLVFYKKYREALELFELLEIEEDYEVSESTYDALASACICSRSIRGVKRILNYMIRSGYEPDQYMSNRVLLMHVKCKMMIDARRLFDEMPERNKVTWNIIIGGLIDSGCYLDAFNLFLLIWNDVFDIGSRTFAMMIRASAGLEHAFLGKQLHSCVLKIGLKDDIFVACALIDMYSKCDILEDAHFVFREMPIKSTVGWNSIIAGYALHGYSEEALILYYEMRDSGIEMDHFTFSILTRICTRLASLEHAKQAHAGLIRHGLGLDVVANTALVDFYSKWGRIEDARHIFDNMVTKNVVSWNALIAGYGNHGRGSEAVKMFNLMLEKKMVPNHITFLAVLSACGYSGLSNRGWDIFKSMKMDHKIKQRAMHYACMIELLGREGHLDEAFAFINDAPVKSTINMWAALLTACRVHKNFELGKFAAEKIYGMEPEKLSNYLILLNIYNNSGNLIEASKVVQTIKKRCLMMLPACSWIEIKKKSHIFLSGDKSHVQTREIYEKLEDLMVKIEKIGYAVEEKYFLADVDEHEQRKVSCHSEKLAIAFGTINTNDLAALQIVQSHRICNDCHNAIKLITMVTGQVIVLRDGSRFHHFENGVCSCGDYW